MGAGILPGKASRGRGGQIWITFSTGGDLDVLHSDQMGFPPQGDSVPHKTSAADHTVGSLLLAFMVVESANTRKSPVLPGTRRRVACVLVGMGGTG